MPWRSGDEPSKGRRLATRRHFVPKSGGSQQRDGAAATVLATGEEQQARLGASVTDKSLIQGYTMVIYDI